MRRRELGRENILSEVSSRLINEHDKDMLVVNNYAAANEMKWGKIDRKKA